MNLISPDEMLAMAVAEMLDGRQPGSVRDWQLVMNYIAANIPADVAESTCLLMRQIYDMPMTEAHVREIVAFQRGLRLGEGKDEL